MMSYTCTRSTHTESLVQSNYQHCIWLGSFNCNNGEIKCKLAFPVSGQSDLNTVRGKILEWEKLVNLANGILFANLYLPITYHNQL